MTGIRAALTCPACGGPVSLREGETHTVCGSCGSRLLLTSAVRRYILPATVSATEVLRAVRRKLQEVDPRGLALARVRRPALYYVPYWHCTASIGGYVLGLDPVFTEKELPLPEAEGQGSGYALPRTRKVKVRTGAESAEREVQITGSVNISAADLEPLGIPSLSADSQLSLNGIAIRRSDLPEGLEVLQDESGREGIFVDPVIPLTAAERQAQRYLERLASGVGHGLEQRWEFTVISGRRSALIYYPVWTAEFTSGGRTFQAVVDGRSGAILRGRFPDRRKDKKILAFSAAVLWAAAVPAVAEMIAGGRLQYVAASSGEAKSCLPWVVLILAALGLGTRRFLQMLEDLRGKGSDCVV